jgi:hypothetical protein
MLRKSPPGSGDGRVATAIFPALIDGHLTEIEHQKSGTGMSCLLEVLNSLCRRTVGI